MIPNINILTEEITETTYPNKTYRIAMDNYRINGETDGLEAVEQAVKLILSTERYTCNIYSWDYGVELVDLIGKPFSYVISELPRRITEALTQDNRITNVTNFEFEKHGKILTVSFTVITNVGDISTTLEVEV